MFIAAEIVPECLPPMSRQKLQLGLIVISRPNVATAKPRIALGALAAADAHSTPDAARTKPAIPGIRRDHVRYRDLYSPSTTRPAHQLAAAPHSSGTMAYRAASL